MQPICHMNLAPGYRGGERQTELLIRELASRGVAQRLIVRKRHVLAEKCADVAGLDIREAASNPIAFGLASKGSDLVHAHDGRTAYSALLANLVFGIPYVITRRVVPKKPNAFVRLMAYRRAARVVAISAAVVEALHHWSPELDPVTIPSANAGFEVDADVVSAIRAKRPGKVLIGHIGAYDHSHKGQLTIIEAARVAEQEHPEWHFLLCGEGKDEARFRAEIGDLPNIELVGWVDNVGDWLAAFDLFVYPSLHEALGSTLLDAMGLGLPIVASNVGGIPEVVKDRVNGRLIAPENAPQLIDALAAIVEQADNSLRDTNRKQAVQHNATRMADAYEMLYREIATTM